MYAQSKVRMSMVSEGELSAPLKDRTVLPKNRGETGPLPAASGPDFHMDQPRILKW